jgi:hypothetical protein
MDPLAMRVAARYAGEVVQLRPHQSGPKIEIAGKHYALSTDSGPLMGDLMERLAPAEGGPRIIEPPEGGNKWKFLWAYDTDAQVLAMWRVSDGDEKFWDNAKAHAAHIVKLDKRGQLNRVDSSAMRQIESFMHHRMHETIEDLQRAVEEYKSDADKLLDKHVREFFATHVKHHVEAAVAKVMHGAIPIGFKAFDPKGNVQRQAASFVIGQVLKRDMSEEKVEAYLHQHGFDMKSVDPQALEWALADQRDKVFEEFLPPR